MITAITTEAVDWTFDCVSPAESSDFDGSPQTILFTAEESEKNVTVGLIDDTEVEGEEFFHAVLTADSPGVVIGRNTSSVVVVDDDSECCCFSSRLKVFVYSNIILCSGWVPIFSISIHSHWRWRLSETGCCEEGTGKCTSPCHHHNSWWFCFRFAHLHT